MPKPPGMSPGQLAQEQKRFNDLIPEDAEKILSQAAGQMPVYRDCPYCTPGQTPVNNLTICLKCGYSWAHGYPTDVALMRKHGDGVDQPYMNKLNGRLHGGQRD